MVDIGTTAKKAYELEMALVSVMSMIVSTSFNLYQALVGARHLCISIRPNGNAGNHGYDWIVRMAGPTGSYYEVCYISSSFFRNSGLMFTFAEPPIRVLLQIPTF